MILYERLAEHPEMDEDDLAEHIAYWLDLD